MHLFLQTYNIIKICVLMSPRETILYSKNIKYKEYSYNSYDDIGVF
jgi:hypothetical protein